MSNSHLSKISIPIYFLPLALVAGPLISELIIIFTSFFVLFYIFKNKDYKYIKNIYFILFILFWFYLIVSNILNFQNVEIILKVLFYIRFGLFSIAVWYLIDKNKNFLPDFYFYFSIVVAILIFDGYLQYFIGINIIGSPLENQRISGLFIDEKVLGTYLSRLVPILIGLIIYLNPKNSKKKLIIFLLASDILIFLSGDRSPLFLLNLSAIFIIIMCNNLRIIRIGTLLSSILLILIISFLDSGVRDRVFTKTFEDLGMLETDPVYTIDNNRNNYIFSPQHENYYTTAIKIYKDKPIIGAGIKSYRNLCKFEKYKIDKYSCSTHPHNTYLELLAETGIIGFAIIFILFLYIIYKSVAHLYKKIFEKKILFSDYQICLLSCFVINLWPIIPTGSFFNNWLSIIYFLPAGFLIHSFNSKKELN